MTDEESSKLEPRKSKVRIKKTGTVHTMIAYLYIFEPPPGYVILLDNGEHYSPEYLDLVE